LGQALTPNDGNLPAQSEQVLGQAEGFEKVVKPQPMDSSNGQDIYAWITSHVWTTRAPDFKHPFGFCPVGEGDSEYMFLENGTYEHRWIPLAGGETMIKASGRWNLQPGPHNSWLACFDNGERHVVVRMEKGFIQLDGYKYPKQVLERQAKAKHFHDMAALSFSDGVTQRIAVLTSRRVWQRANDVNLDRFPATIEFRSDFTYLARSASGRPYPVGTWYATAHSVLASGPLDAQGESDYLRNYGAHLPIVITNPDQLIIGNAPYVTQDLKLSKGTICHFGGYGLPIRVQVEYEMPIFRGIPCRFDIHFIAAPDMTLQRFSFTRDFEHEYRLPDGAISNVNELAAINLNNRFLKVGESKSFSIDVVFPESGNQTYYLNAMIKGSTQNWDEREAITFRVSE
jgi:hypothetical protein